MSEATVQSKPSILVVDDNPLIINVLRSLFGSQDYQVFTSNNGKEAIDVLGSKDVDVIVCDVMMPEMDGYDFHTFVREHNELAHIPFVFLTALGSADEVNRGKETGADDYIIKPFDPKNLLSVVKGKVSRSRELRISANSRYDTYRRRVIHTLSHEFRTPLVAINTGTELLLGQEGGLDEGKVRNLLEAIHRGGQRLEHLVTDFMLVQQIEAGIADQMFKSQARHHLFSDVVQCFLRARAEWLEAGGFSTLVQDNCGDLRVHVYEPHIHDILNRIFANAVKFSPEFRTIEVCLYPCFDEVVIEVRDRGIGINVERVQEAIDVFGQIDRDKLEQQGSGLGLAIASRYAGINNGRLEFERRSVGGTTVALFLPIAAA